MLKQINRMLLIGLSLLGCITAALAAPASKQVKAVEKKDETMLYLLSKEYHRETCPPIEALEQTHDKRWKAPGGWLSSDPSFVTSLQEFYGAQWSGVNVGSVVCMYIKSGRHDFPVSIYRPTVVKTPNGGAWVEKGGHKECFSKDRQECAFEVEKTVRSKKTIYDELDFYKGKPTNN